MRETFDGRRLDAAVVLTPVDPAYGALTRGMLFCSSMEELMSSSASWGLSGWDGCALPDRRKDPNARWRKAENELPRRKDPKDPDLSAAWTKETLFCPSMKPQLGCACATELFNSSKV
mmetsp:Transcript_59591/g.177298  ORF Transcript_59591/g.177298 Transcript_59591/m.177298 type:complete len:118 (-) Transcript_59591:918-1271(-)